MELALAIGGLVAGILAGVLGIGGGVILVPLQVSLGSHRFKLQPPATFPSL